MLADFDYCKGDGSNNRRQLRERQWYNKGLFSWFGFIRRKKYCLEGSSCCRKKPSVTTPSCLIWFGY